MAYAEPDKIRSRTDALASETDSAFTEAQTWAAALIDSRLALVPRFTVPFSDDAVPAIVVEIAADLAASFQLAKLYTQSGADEQLKGSQFFEARGKKELDSLAAGTATAPSSSAVDLPPSTIVSTSAAPVLRDFDLYNQPRPRTLDSAPGPVWGYGASWWGCR